LKSAAPEMINPFFIVMNKFFEIFKGSCCFLTEKICYFVVAGAFPILNNNKIMNYLTENEKFSFKEMLIKILLISTRIANRSLFCIVVRLRVETIQWYRCIRVCEKEIGVH